jgi:serine protease AprX
MDLTTSGPRRIVLPQMEAGSPVRSNRVPVAIRLTVPAGSSATEVYSLRERWDRTLDIELDRDYRPVPISPPRRAREDARERGSQLVVVRAWVHPEHIARLRTQPHVDHIEHDARIEPFARPTVQERAAVNAAVGRVDCGTGQVVGTAADVAKDLGVTRIWAAGSTGRGIVVGVVDGGITAHGRPTRFNEYPAIPHAPATGKVIGGWPADWGTTAQGWGHHGNMIAFDIQAMAPEAELWDIRIWQPDATFPSYVFNAVTGYQLAIQNYKTHGAPQILINSWGVYDSDNGPDYAFNPQSNIALKVEEAVDAGILVLFAAGNCGDGCPFAAGTLCGGANRGPGASILGPNGHPDVMTVGAASIHGAWCGYTSQGPASLPPNDPDKPDFCAVSEFEGYFPNESGLRSCDGGTSAATGIAGGIVALLKQARPDLTQDECKRLLKETARPIKTPAAYGGAGAGVIDALRAFRAL